MSLEQTRSCRMYEGEVKFFTHASTSCQGPMKFSVYLPPQALKAGAPKLPALYYLAGLTCTEETFMAEAGGPEAYAKKYGVILVAPDTSPRGTGIEGEDDSYDLGSGASFYVNATQPKWSKHYQMDTYVTQELRKIVEEKFPVVDRSKRGIIGHSMGGHGALVLGLRNPDLYRTISAFAPICAPSKCPWGIKAFTEYLGSDRAAWARYDASELLKKGSKASILIDQGLNDEFFATELFTDELEKAAKVSGAPLTLRRHAEYDHSYYFISTWIEEHIAFHAG